MKKPKKEERKSNMDFIYVLLDRGYYEKNS